MELKVTTPEIKRGLVTVLNKDGTFNREILLTAEEYTNLGLPDAGAPKGVTQEEWESQYWDETQQAMLPRAYASGQYFNIGDVEEKEGKLTVLYETKQVDGQTKDIYLQFEPTEWNGDIENISVTDEAIASLPPDNQSLSIKNGVLVNEP